MDSATVARGSARVRLLLLGVALAAAVVATLAIRAPAAGSGAYEVWAIDQSNSPGKTFGGTLYIWDGHDLERGRAGAAARPGDGSISAAPPPRCASPKTGANPVRPHMLAINAVADARRSSRSSPPAMCCSSTPRPGRRSTASARPSAPAARARCTSRSRRRTRPTSRSRTRTASSSSASTPTTRPTRSCSIAAGIDLATCTTPNGVACQDAGLRPDNAPICPIIESTSRFTLRHASRRRPLRRRQHGHADAASSPSTTSTPCTRTAASAPRCRARCTSTRAAAPPTNLFEADLYAFPVDRLLAAQPAEHAGADVVFSDDVDEADAHGATLTKHQRYLWVADRGRNFLLVVDTATDQIVNAIQLAPAPSRRPDARSPARRRRTAATSSCRCADRTR